jgi:AsmA protein
MIRGRSLLLAVAALAGLAAFSIGSTRWQLPHDAVRGRLEQALIRDTGYRITSLGGAAFTAFPWPVLQIENLELANVLNAGETASVPLAKARLNLFSWLAGDPRITSLTLFEPKLNLHAADRPEEAEAVAALVGNYLRRGNRPSLTHLRVQGAEATLDRAPWLSRLTATVSNVAASDLRMEAAGIYRALPFRLQAEVSPAARAAVRPISWDFELSDLSATFRGVLVAAPSLDADGRFSIALGAGALRSRPLGLSREAAGLLDGLSIEGEGRMSLPQVQFRSVSLERGGLKLSGAADAVLSASAPRIAATLHAGALDVGSGSIQGALAAAEQVLRGQVDPRSAMRGLNADLRLSVEMLAIGGLRLREAAGSAKLSAGRLEVALSEGRIGGGGAKARAVITAADGRTDARLNAQVEQVDIAAALGGGTTSSATGLATAQISIETSGRSAGELAAGLTGRGNLAVANGSLSGVDIDRALRRADAAEMRLPDGRTPFAAMEAAWTMAEGVAVLSDAAIRGMLWSARLDGTVNLKHRMVDVVARVVSEAAPGRREERAIGIKGPFSAPDIRFAPPPQGRS